MTRINYLSDESNSRTPLPGRPIRSEVVRENFQVLANAGSLWAYDTVTLVDQDSTSGDNLMTRSGSTVTVTTREEHELSPGDEILITGADGVTTDYNGVYTVDTVPDVFSFTYDIGGDTPNSPATGSVRVRHHNRLGVTKGSYQISGTLNHTFEGGISSQLDLGTGAGDVADGLGVFIGAGEAFIAVLSINAGGVMTWTKGESDGGSGSPSAPTYPSNQIPICEVFVNYDSIVFGGGGGTVTENSLPLSEETQASLSGAMSSTTVTVSLEEHGFLVGDVVRITKIETISGDSASAYEEGFHTIASVPDRNTFTYTVAGPFTVNSTATAKVNDFIVDVRPLINLGGGGGGGGGNFWSDPVDSNIIPDTNNAYDFGSLALKFKDGYFAGKLTVDGPIDPTYINLTAVDPGVPSGGDGAPNIMDNSFFLDINDNVMKFKNNSKAVFNIGSPGAAFAEYDADTVTDFPAGLPDGQKDEFDISTVSLGTATEEGLIVKVELTDFDSLGSGDVLVEIYNDEPRTALVFSRVFDLAQTPLVDTIPTHFQSDNVAGSGALYLDITNSTGSTGRFQVNVRTSAIVASGIAPITGTGAVGVGDAGDGLNFNGVELEIELSPSDPGLELVGSSPNATLRAKVGDGIQRTGSGIAADATVIRTTGDQNMAGQKRFTDSVFGLTPAGSPGPPTSGTFQAGDFYLDSDLVLFQCTVGGTPGTWKFWGWSFAQGVDLGIVAGEDNATYTDIASGGSSVTVEVSTGISTTAEGNRRGVIRRLLVWGAEATANSDPSTIQTGDIDQPFRVACHPNENRFGRDQLWLLNGQIRKVDITGSVTGGVDNTIPVTDSDIADQDSLVRLRRQAATVGEEYARITIRRTSPVEFDVDEAVLNSFATNDPFMVVTEAIELSWINNSSIPANRDKVFLEFFNDGVTDLIFGFQLDVESIGGGSF